jgi:hypothetical protein
MANELMTLDNLLASVHSLTSATTSDGHTRSKRTAARKAVESWRKSDDNDDDDDYDDDDDADDVNNNNNNNNSNNNDDDDDDDDDDDHDERSASTTQRRKRAGRPASSASAKRAKAGGGAQRTSRTTTSPRSATSSNSSATTGSPKANNTGKSKTTGKGLFFLSFCGFDGVVVAMCERARRCRCRYVVVHNVYYETICVSIMQFVVCDRGVTSMFLAMLSMSLALCV